MIPNRKAHYSVLVPAYNEEENILLVAQKFAEVFKQTSDQGEVIFIDDGSTDRTRGEAEKAKREFPFVKVVSYTRNQGKTSAMMSGFKIASGDIYVIFDADLQFDPWDVPRLVAEIDKGADIATGWKQGKYEKRFISIVYNWLCRRF